MENNNEKNILFNKKQVAEILNVSGKTISRLIDKGEFPFIRIGRRKYVSKQVVLDWVEAKHDIIGGAWSRCYLNQETAYATL